MPPPRCSVSSACLQNESRWSLKVKEVCSVSVGMGFMLGYYGGVRQVTPKLPCFNAPVTVRTNCFANKNETLPRLAGWMDGHIQSSVDTAQFWSCLWMCVLKRHSVRAPVWDVPSASESPQAGFRLVFFSYSLLTSHLYPSSYRVFFPPKFKISLL